MTPESAIVLIMAESDKSNTKTTVTIVSCASVPDGATLPLTDEWASLTANLRHTKTFLYTAVAESGPDIAGAGFNFTVGDF